MYYLIHRMNVTIRYYGKWNDGYWTDDKKEAFIFTKDEIDKKLVKFNGVWVARLEVLRVSP